MARMNNELFHFLTIEIFLRITLEVTKLLKKQNKEGLNETEMFLFGWQKDKKQILLQEYPNKLEKERIYELYMGN